MISLSNYLKEFQSNNIQIIENTDFIHLDEVQDYAKSIG